MKKLTAFVVEDNIQYAEMICYVLNQTGLYQAYTFYSVDSCVQQLNTQPDLVVLDYHLNTSPDKKNGDSVLNHIQQEKLNTSVVLLSGQDKISIAVNALKDGVYDYIIKNDYAIAKITLAAQHIATMKQLLADNEKLGRKVKRDKLNAVLLLLVLVGLFTLNFVLNK
jgi:DNA-binding NtrC family response regulator